MKFFLFAKNKSISLMELSINQMRNHKPIYMRWMRCDAITKGWLTTATEKDIRSSVKYANIASKIWSNLEERFGKKSASRAYELKQSLATKRQEVISISSDYTELRSIWDEIQSTTPTLRRECVGYTYNIGKRLNESKDKERFYKFLMGLDNEYYTIKTQILAMKPTPSLSAVFHLVAEDEHERAITATKKPTNKVTAF